LHPGPFCSWGALLLTSRFLTLALAVLPLLLPDLLALLALLLVSLQILLRILRPPLALQLLEGRLSLRLVRSPVQRAILLQVRFARSPCICTRLGLDARPFPLARVAAWRS
jgi:hypothetical protein